MTNLLKQQEKLKISAVKANKVLVDLGILEEKQRESSKYAGKMKKYKSLTSKGLEFGVNQENPNSPGQTTPYYYAEKFEELLEILQKGMATDEKKS